MLDFGTLSPARAGDRGLRTCCGTASLVALLRSSTASCGEARSAIARCGVLLCWLNVLRNLLLAQGIAAAKGLVGGRMGLWIPRPAVCGITLSVLCA